MKQSLFDVLFCVFISLQAIHASTSSARTACREILRFREVIFNGILRGKALAEAWQALPEGEEKKSALADIKNRWQAENWWDEPNGKSARQAKAIYEQN
ncbi:MAG: hypothetical protein HOP23_07330 [Methylococcaceae bacterium]|nr:hypothetical protein [Methylococcaceae bacterium]